VRNLLFYLLFRFLGDRLKDTGSTFRDSILLFLKGTGMGAADIIPGVSGGTVAFITGIYEELIDAIKSINFRFLVYFFRGFVSKEYFSKSYDAFREIHFRFLITLLLGIGVAFVALANVIGPARELYPTYSASFFLGLILSSAVFVYRSTVDKFSFKIVIPGIFGFFVGIIIVGLTSVQTSHSIVVIGLAGVVTVCAMILPGISGAFILWLIGQYDFMLDVLRRLIVFDFSQMWFVVAYVVGGVVGILSFARFLSFLLHNYRLVTLAFLLGLMIGALRKPAEVIIESPENLGVTILAGVFGVLVVGVIGYLNERSSKKRI
jgi:putative membrane protein